MAARPPLSPTSFRVTSAVFTVAPQTFHSKVAGVSWSNPNGKSRQDVIRAYCRPGMPLVLRREPENPYDANAVGVWIRTRVFLFFETELQIGYLNRSVAREIAEHVDNGGPVTARITEVTGGSTEKPTYGVNIELAKTWAGAS